MCVSRMQPERYPHILLDGCIAESQLQGRPRKRWLLNIKVLILRNINININIRASDSCLMLDYVRVINFRIIIIIIKKEILVITLVDATRSARDGIQ